MSSSYASTEEDMSCTNFIQLKVYKNSTCLKSPCTSQVYAVELSSSIKEIINRNQTQVFCDKCTQPIKHCFKYSGGLVLLSVCHWQKDPQRQKGHFHNLVHLNKIY